VVRGRVYSLCVKLGILLTALTFAIGCSEPAPSPNRSATTSTPSGPEGITAEPSTPSPALRAEVRSLGQSFNGGKSCVTSSMERLRVLRARYGVELVRDALILAYDGCSAPMALADLLRETMSASPTDSETLQLGVALIEASDYVEAADVLSDLADRSPAGSKVRWIAGFALLHAGAAKQALPWLLEGRLHAQGNGGSEGPLLIGLAHLQLDNVSDAIKELEAGLVLAPTDPSALSALARAYTRVGRDGDAARLAKEARQEHQAIAERERTLHELSALSTNLSKAWDARNYAEVEKLVDRLWPLAPPQLRPTVLEYRIAVYAETGRDAEAAAARVQLSQLRRSP